MRKSAFLKLVYFFTCFVLYISLPFYLTRKNPYILAIFYFVNLTGIYFLHRLYQNKKYRVSLRVQDLEEKINILSDQDFQEARNKASLEQKIKRYRSLKEVIEAINRNLSLESAADNLATATFSLIGGNKGTCILYLMDSATQKLALLKTKKEDKKMIIKDKEGDIFDFWVTRHMSPLLIEDIHRDFRFDTAQMQTYHRRAVTSLVSAPLITEHKFVGILRIDNETAGAYSQDDLRLLVTLCDLGAVSLENGQLFQKTQDLAIHDGLTGLYTKGYFLGYMQQEFKRSQRQKNALTLIMFDIDYFKNYNDKFGHAAGDLVLANISKIAVDFLKDFNPLICRFGGEEFCVLITHLEKDRAITLAQGLRAQIEKTKILLRRQETYITVSIGVSCFPNHAASDDELIAGADRAMYEAKQQGRNRVVEAH